MTTRKIICIIALSVLQASLWKRKLLSQQENLQYVKGSAEDCEASNKVMILESKTKKKKKFWRFEQPYT